jgi:hypothetical protein
MSKRGSPERAAYLITTGGARPLLAAGDAIPDDIHLAHLREFIDQALAEVERL